jgi:hypothetical protein
MSRWVYLEVEVVMCAQTAHRAMRIQHNEADLSFQLLQHGMMYIYLMSTEAARIGH